MSALKRLGFNGVITKKIMITTSSTSISGVTLMNGTARPPEPDIPIRITSLRKTNTQAKPVTWRPRQEFQSLTGRSRRGSDLSFTLLLIGHQAYPINAFFANRVDYVDDLAIADLNATLDIDDLFVFLLVCQRFFHAGFEFVEAHLLLAQVVFTIFRNRDDHGTVSIDRRVLFRIFHVTGQGQLNVLLEEGRDHHED